MDVRPSGMATLPPAAIPSAHQPLLHRHSIKPGHLDAWLQLWPEQVALWRRHGFVSHRAFLQEHAEPKLTWVYSHQTPPRGADSLAADPERLDLGERLGPHVFRNNLVRPVRVEQMTTATEENVTGRIAIMRRYVIVGSWLEFLGIWRRIVPLREEYGFRCLFAVADEAKDMFTWAFDFGGEWEQFQQAQRPYYRDPARVALRGVFDYMADYAVDPARQLVLPIQ